MANSLIFDDAYAHARHGYFIPTLLTGVGNAPLLVSKFELIYDKTMFNYDLDFLIDNIFSMLALELNDTVKLIHNRYGLDAGKYMRIISLEIPNAINKLVKIRGWG